MIERTTRIPGLGPRGEGWVIIQSILIVVVAVAGLVGARWPDNLRVPARVTAIISGVAGLWLVSSGVGTLGKSLSPLPKPPTTSELKESGAYALVRHPIYGGILLLSLAWSLDRLLRAFCDRFLTGLYSNFSDLHSLSPNWRV